MKKISYLGPKGTYCSEACDLYIRNRNYLQIEAKSINDVVKLLVDDQVDECIVPIENSIKGTVLETLDSIIDSRNIHIIGEIIINIHHYLVSNKNEIKEGIKTIYSHHQALGQCKKYIENNFKNVDLNEVESTAKAASLLNDNKGSAAICSEHCARIYDLKIIDKNIEDAGNNQTRFVILSKKKHYNKKNNNKISIMFVLKNKPGTLYSIIKTFDKYKINMTKIESHPLKTGLGNYWFWVDIDGNISENKIKIAFKIIKNNSLYFKVLGEYSSIL